LGEWVLSGGGAPSGFAIRRRSNSRQRAVGETTFLIGLRRVPSTAVSASKVLALSHGGASAPWATKGRARSTPRVLRTLAPIIRSGVWVTWAGRLVSNGVVRSPASVGTVVALPSRRLTAGSKRRGLFDPVVSGAGSFGHAGHHVGRGERPKRFHVSRFVVRDHPVDTRRSGAVRTPWLSRTFCPQWAPSTDRPTRKWSRRAQRTCAILAPRRAAHLQR
jgi:hypothetical protein